MFRCNFYLPLLFTIIAFYYIDNINSQNVCTDISSQCECWAEIGYCTRHSKFQGFMLLFCCQSCSGITTDSETYEYEFNVTETKATFDEARAECVKLGGDLLQKNFGPAGAKYHKEIEALVSQYKRLWIGYTDREEEGTWKLLDGELYDAHDTNLGGFCNWGPSEPNNHMEDQNCAQIIRGPALDDYYCDKRYHGLCEIKISRCRV